MASSTPNLDLTLPVGGENVSRQIINANNVKIDEAVGAVPSGTDLQSQVTALNNNINIQALTSTEGIKTVAMDNNRCPANTVRWFNLRLSDSSELPGTGQVYGVARVTKRVNSTCFIETFDDGGSIWRTSYDGSSWSAWQQLVLKSELTDLGITSSKQLTVTKNNSISTVVILAYRVGQLMFIGGYFSNTSSIANGTTIASVAPISAINPGNYACPAVQSDDNSISYLSFSYLNNLVDIKINGNLGANKYCRFFMILPYT